MHDRQLGILAKEKDMITQLIVKRFVLVFLVSLSLSACEPGELIDPQPDLDVISLQEKGAKTLPFHGNTTGTLVGQTFPAPGGRCPSNRPILAEYIGSGTATHLGRFTVSGGECMFFDPGPPAALSSGEGRYRLTAANGDWLDVAYDLPTVGFEGPTSPWVLWSASVRVEEGSGRFQGAEFVEVIWAGGFNSVTQETYSTLDGKIRYDASMRSH
jgi:hypothetical protein